MLRIAFSTLAGRKAGAVGAFVGVVLATVLAGSMAILLQSSLQAPIGVERLQQASIVVEGRTTIAPARDEGTIAVPLLERSRIDESITERLRGIDGVSRVIADRSVYAALVGSDG